MKSNIFFPPYALPSRGHLFQNNTTLVAADEENIIQHIENNPFTIFSQVTGLFSSQSYFSSIGTSHNQIGIHCDIASEIIPIQFRPYLTFNFPDYANPYQQSYGFSIQESEAICINNSSIKNISGQNEASGIFSKNNMNVSITESKIKNIVTHNCPLTFYGFFDNESTGPIPENILHDTTIDNDTYKTVTIPSAELTAPSTLQIALRFIIDNALQELPFKAVQFIR